MLSTTLTHNQIRLSPFNVRTKLHDAPALEALAASILAKGLRVPLEVHPMKGNGSSRRAGDIYGAFAGGGRYRAIGKLIERGDLPADWEIRVDLYDELTEGQLVLGSLVENEIRYSLRDFETYIGVLRAHRMGQSVDDIAGALGGRDRHEILQWLRLGELAKPVFEAFTAGRLTLDQARAYAATDDHKLQLAAFDALKGALLSRPSDIRAWMKFNDPVAERELLYVGEEAYTAAGGALQQDLFAEQGERRRLIVNPQLLRKLVDTKLSTLMEELRGRVDRDVRFVKQPPQNDFGIADHFLLVDPRDGEGDAIELPDGDIVGCVILDEVGKPDATWWWSSRAAKYGEARAARPHQAAAAGKSAVAPVAEAPAPDPASDADALDPGTIEILRSQRRAILRAALVDNARCGGTIARDYLVFAQLRLQIRPGSHQGVVGMPRLLIQSGPEAARPYVAEMPGSKVWGQAIADLSRHPVLSIADELDAWWAFAAAPQSIRDLAAAVVTGLALERSLSGAGLEQPIHDDIAASIGLADNAAVRRYWTPTAELLGRLPVAQRLAIAEPLVDEAAFGAWSIARPGDITRRLLAIVTGTAEHVRVTARAAAARWVHPLLRFGGPEDPEDPGVNDVAASPELEAAE